MGWVVVTADYRFVFIFLWCILVIVLLFWLIDWLMMRLTDMNYFRYLLTLIFQLITVSIRQLLKDTIYLVKFVYFQII
jgi:hypothetical protein